MAAETRTEQQQKKFLDAFRECVGNIGAAINIVGISRSAVALWRRKNPAFDAAFRAIQNSCTPESVIFQTVAENPGLTELDIRLQTGLSKMTTFRKLHALIKSGRIVRERDTHTDGRPLLRYYEAGAQRRQRAADLDRRPARDYEQTALAVIREFPGLSCDEIGNAAGIKTGNDFYKPLRFLTERGAILKVKRPTSRRGRTFCYYPNDPDGRRLAELERNVPVHTGERNPYGTTDAFHFVAPAPEMNRVVFRAKIAAAIRLAGRLDVERIADRIGRDADAIRAELRKMTDAGQVDFETVTFRRTDGLLGIRRFYYLV